MTAYSEAPLRWATSRAITSVVRSRLPPWKAMTPNGSRSSHTSSTSGWASSAGKLLLNLMG